MSALFLNYHRTERRPESKDVYVLTSDEFARQMQLVADSGISVLDPHVLDGSENGHRLAITFDDGYKSDLENAALLARRGYSAMFFISTANIGKPGYLDSDEIRELEKMGMVIGSHSHHHKRLNTLEEIEIQAELSSSKDILEEILGHPISSIAFPGGGYNRVVIEEATRLGFRYLLTTDWGLARLPRDRDFVLINRNNILRGMTDVAFTHLITLKSLRSRQARFLAKQFVQSMLPEAAYRKLRALLG